jgi:2-oxo-hept-3-ene-1,7-dioate hydratase
MLIISPHPFSYYLAPSFIRPIETRKGDTIQADDGPCGTVSCYFA